MTRGEIELAGRKAYVYTMDVSKKHDIEATVDALLEAAGSIDVLVNNAGILKPSLLQDLDEASWDAHFNVNAKGVLMMCQAVLPHMRAKRSGRVINIASIAGRQGVPTQGHYAATKATVITLTRVLAQEVGMDGVTVNAICPGIILTEMGKNNLGSEAAIHHWEDVGAKASRRAGGRRRAGAVLRFGPVGFRHRTVAQRRRRDLLPLTFVGVFRWFELWSRPCEPTARPLAR
ncbi:hypothetical protein MES5069_270017 [Mesorhizobium escarrei]|uniref:SDR family oxidoreductase n=1 Tax=Mesorhizobium escarrei TaxID=666018 RepID=A0ABN8JTL0_9HYPH|nr:hypothetical protein MES5069_270017 [Mesorhizobium escarrei]